MASSSKRERATAMKENGGVDELGMEILGRIFSHLPPISLVYCTAVCSSWHSIISSSPSLWRTAYFLRSHMRLKTNHLVKIGTAAAATSSVTVEKKQKRSADGDADAEFRTRYIDEELRTRLARGPVSTWSWKAHSGRVNCCKMVMGQIVSGSSDRTVRVWSAKTFKCLELYQVPEKAPVVEVEFDENKVMGAAGKNVLVWSRMGNRRLLRKMGGQSEISSMCVADSDLAIGCKDGTVRVFDLYSSRCTQIFRLHTEPVKAVVMDMTTQTMASGSSDGTVQLFDARSGQRIASLLRPSSMTGISCLHSSPQDQRLFIGNMGADLYCVDLRNQKHVWDIRVLGGALTCMDSPSYSSATIAVGGVAGQMNVFDVESARRIVSFQLLQPRLPSSPVLSMALGMTKLFSCHADGSIIQWKLGESRPSCLEAEYNSPLGYERLVEKGPRSPFN